MLSRRCGRPAPLCLCPLSLPPAVTAAAVPPTPLSSFPPPSLLLPSPLSKPLLQQTANRKRRTKQQQQRSPQCFFTNYFSISSSSSSPFLLHRPPARGTPLRASIHGSLAARSASCISDAPHTAPDRGILVPFSQYKASSLLQLEASSSMGKCHSRAVSPAADHNGHRHRHRMHSPATIGDVYLRKAQENEEALRKQSTFETERRYSETKEAYSANGTLSYRGSRTESQFNRASGSAPHTPGSSAYRQSFVYPIDAADLAPPIMELQVSRISAPNGRQSYTEPEATTNLGPSPRTSVGAAFSVDAELDIPRVSDMPLPAPQRIKKIPPGAKSGFY